MLISPPNKPEFLELSPADKFQHLRASKAFLLLVDVSPRPQISTGLAERKILPAPTFDPSAFCISLHCSVLLLGNIFLQTHFLNRKICCPNSIFSGTEPFPLEFRFIQMQSKKYSPNSFSSMFSLSLSFLYLSFLYL